VAGLDFTHCGGRSSGHATKRVFQGPLVVPENGGLLGTAGRSPGEYKAAASVMCAACVCSPTGTVSASFVESCIVSERHPACVKHVSVRRSVTVLNHAIVPIAPVIGHADLTSSG
jgi:hypothetical protein